MLHLKFKIGMCAAMEFVLIVVFVVVSTDGANNEGDSCDAFGTAGVCRKVNKCSTAIADIKRNQSPPTCSNDSDEIIVCCKNEGGNGVLTTTPRYTTSTVSGYVPKDYEYVDSKTGPAGGLCRPVPESETSKTTGQKAFDKCIEYQEKYVFPCERSEAIIGGYARKNHCHHNADELIIQGVAAGKWEFPHMALLGYQNEQGQILYQCGGAIISEKFILTAGHCISDTSANNVSHVVVGIIKRSEESNKNRYVVKRVIPHRDYLSPSKYNDIALLELEKPIALDDSTVPACLHIGDNVDESRASVTGWGTTVPNRQVNSDELRKVIVSKFSTEECSDAYAPYRHLLEGFKEDSQICYGDKTTSVDTCRGDSGGPLTIKSKKIGCMYTIIGVTSFGHYCGTVGVPGIYTRVHRYLRWIEDIVWPN